jgi:hypothetical protein
MLARKFDIPKAARITCVKPSGTVSLLAGATPGMHWPESQYYIRRVRLARTSPILPILTEAGYNIEQDVVNERSMVVEFPINIGDSVHKTLKNVTIEEQMDMAAFLQKNWADSAVSCTVSFDPDLVTPKYLADLLSKYDKFLKGISFLPRAGGNSGSTKVYPQLPYEEITQEVYESMVSKLKPCDYSKISDECFDIPGEDCNESDVPDELKFCDGDKCLLKI